MGTFTVPIQIGDLAGQRFLDIDGLEYRMVEIQMELEEASKRRDLAMIARLGREYDRTITQLDEKLAEWGG